MGLHHEALRFYEPLQQVKDYTDTSFFIDMASCYRAVGLVTEAEDCYQTIIKHDENNIEARVQLAKLFESLGMPEQAFTYLSEVMLLENDKSAARPAVASADLAAPTMLAHCVSRPAARKRTTGLDVVEKAALDYTREENIRILHQRLLGLREQMLAGDDESTVLWLTTARDLILDFRSNRLFFPWDKYVQFYGYSKEARKKALKPKSSETLDEMEAMAERLQSSLGKLLLHR